MISTNQSTVSGIVLQAGWVWSHVSGQAVSLQSDSLLHLLEIERLYLQKQAQVTLGPGVQFFLHLEHFQNSLASADLGTIIRIPRGRTYINSQAVIAGILLLLSLKFPSGNFQKFSELKD